MDPSMAIDGAQTFEHWADHEDLEVGFRALWNAMQVAFVLDHEMRRIETLGQLVLNSFLAIHTRSLPRPCSACESLRQFCERTAVSFAFRAIQRRA